MKKKLSRILIVIAAMTMMLGMMTITASAKTIKPKKNDFTTSAAKAAKKSTTVKKGNYTIIVPKTKKSSYGSFFLKFTAPSTKTYTFTISGLVPESGDTYCNGHGYVMVGSKYGGDSITMATVKTEGGKNSSLYYSCKDPDSYSSKIYAYLKKRSAKIKLNAGQTVYLYCYSSADHLSYSIK